MADVTYLASALVMGVSLLGVVFLAARVRRWQNYAPSVAYGDMDAGPGGRQTAFSKFVNAPRTWVAAFVVLALGFMAGTMVYISGLASGIAGTALIGALGAAVVVYLVGGVYYAMRERGRPSAQAAATSAITLGSLFALVILLKLVTA
jgi:hypothetical protein